MKNEELGSLTVSSTALGRFCRSPACNGRSRLEAYSVEIASRRLFEDCPCGRASVLASTDFQGSASLFGFARTLALPGPGSQTGAKPGGSAGRGSGPRAEPGDGVDRYCGRDQCSAWLMEIITQLEIVRNMHSPPCAGGKAGLQILAGTENPENERGWRCAGCGWAGAGDYQSETSLD